MHLDIKTEDFRFDGSKKATIKDLPTSVAPLYEDKKDYKKLLEEYREEIDDLQNMMYAHDRYSLLLIFQAMDAAGKDGTIKHVMSGVNPHGVEVSSFKRPSETELDHDFLWRTYKKLPGRGKIGIFNRSYYEEVLIVKVHPGILTGSQRLPKEAVLDMDKVWEGRYASINQMETHLSNNGTQTLKFFLNLSKEEQRQRFLARLNTPSKNWKFSGGDVKERGYWDKYMQAYQDCINATGSPHAPWYVIPADDKKNMRLIVSAIILDHLKKLDMSYPSVDEERKAQFQQYREMLNNE
ncbi:MAG: polyphosphate kinase 2 family protein [Bacteroidia bacterium]|nr:polyphosphate kinase 2 family protein [Bacteroidia bacterium]